MFRSLLSNFLEKNALKGVARFDLRSDDLMSQVATYLTELIGTPDRKRLYIDNDHIFFRGQNSNDLPLCSSFWTEDEQMARNYANPLLLEAKLIEPVIFIEINSFLDCLISRFCEHEEFGDYIEANSFLRRLSEAGFFDQFTEIDGIIDPTSNEFGGFRRVYFFESKKLQKLTSTNIHR